MWVVCDVSLLWSSRVIVGTVVSFGLSLKTDSSPIFTTSQSFPLHVTLSSVTPTALKATPILCQTVRKHPLRFRFRNQHTHTHQFRLFIKHQGDNVSCKSNYQLLKVCISEKWNMILHQLWLSNSCLFFWISPSSRVEEIKVQVDVSQKGWSVIYCLSIDMSVKVFRPQPCHFASTMLVLFSQTFPWTAAVITGT